MFQKNHPAIIYHCHQIF